MVSGSTEAPSTCKSTRVGNSLGCLTLRDNGKEEYYRNQEKVAILIKACPSTASTNTAFSFFCQRLNREQAKMRTIKKYQYEGVQYKVQVLSLHRMPIMTMDGGMADCQETAPTISQSCEKNTKK